MKPSISGLHHVTAISGPAQANVNFYVGVLGLRLVKKTVNFDDPGTYHLYYGDEAGRPGTIMTFFPWADAIPGRTGAGMTQETAFSVPPGALDYWVDRLAGLTLDFDAPTERFGQAVLGLRDPDGLRLELVTDAGATEAGWAEGPVLAEHAIRSFHGVSFASLAPDATARLLTDVFGYEAVGEEAGRLRFQAVGEGPGRVVDLVQKGQGVRGRPSTGTIHHVAFRARTAEEQMEWQERVSAAGLQVTPVQDRNYFTSIYFREPGGVLFEIATDAPGFGVDELPEALGTALKLPPQYEPYRDRIEARLVPITMPQTAQPETTV